MTFRVKRDYGNGIQAEVSAEKMTELIEKLGVCDELFMDIRCAANIDGENVVSEKVRFGHRKVGDDNYYEQTCMDGKLKWYKRRLGQHKGSSIGSLFVHTKPSDKPEVLASEVQGYAGWAKYVGTGSGSNGFASNHQPQQQQPQQQRQAPHPPPPQVNYQQPALDDIPF